MPHAAEQHAASLLDAFRAVLRCYEETAATESQTEERWRAVNREEVAEDRLVAAKASARARLGIATASRVIQRARRLAASGE